MSVILNVEMKSLAPTAQVGKVEGSSLAAAEQPAVAEPLPTLPAAQEAAPLIAQEGAREAVAVTAEPLISEVADLAVL